MKRLVVCFVLLFCAPAARAQTLPDPQEPPKQPERRPIVLGANFTQNFVSGSGFSHHNPVGVGIELSAPLFSRFDARYEGEVSFGPKIQAENVITKEHRFSASYDLGLNFGLMAGYVSLGDDRRDAVDAIKSVSENLKGLGFGTVFHHPIGPKVQAEVGLTDFPRMNVRQIIDTPVKIVDRRYQFPIYQADEKVLRTHASGVLFKAEVIAWATPCWGIKGGIEVIHADQLNKTSLGFGFRRKF